MLLVCGLYILAANYRLILSWKLSDREGCRSLWVGMARLATVILCFVYHYSFTADFETLFVIIFMLQGNQPNPEQQSAQEDAKRLVYQSRFLVMLLCWLFNSVAWIWFQELVHPNIFLMYSYIFSLEWHFFYLNGKIINLGRQRKEDKWCLVRYCRLRHEKDVSI